MDNDQALYEEVSALTDYNAMSLIEMTRWAFEHRKHKNAMQIASSVWGRNARIYAKTFKLFRFEMKRGVSVDEMLSLIAMASLPEHEAALLAEQWKSHTMPYYEVRAAVDARKKRPSKAQTVNKLNRLVDAGNALCQELDSLISYLAVHSFDTTKYSKAIHEWMDATREAQP